MKIIKFLTLICFLHITFGNTITCPCRENQAFDIISWSCQNYPYSQSSQYVKNCQNYIIIYGQFQCVKCQDSFYLINNSKNNKQECIKTELEGCNDIRKGHWLKEGQNYQESRLLQLVKSNRNRLSSEQDKYKCYSCSSDYYMKDGQCEPNPSYYSNDSINYCDLYQWKNNQLVCFQCKQGYYTSFDSQKCIQNPRKQQNCKKFNLDKYAGQVVCEQCQEGYSITQNYQCVKSDSIIENCQNAIHDRFYHCLECKDGYFFQQDSQTCIKNPIQGQNGYVKNCKNYQYYKGEIRCSWCNEDYSLDTANGYVCNQVIQFDLVDYCIGYITQKHGDQNQCQGCQAGFFPTTNNIRGCRQCPY